LTYLALPPPVTGPALIAAGNSPLVAKDLRFEDRGDGRDVVGGVLREVAQFGRVDVAPGIFHVIRVVAEPAQPDEVMEKLIGDAGQRVPKQNPENDDLSFAPLRLHPSRSTSFLFSCPPFSCPHFPVPIFLFDSISSLA